MAADPTAREIARRLIDEVLAERSMSRPDLPPPPAVDAEVAVATRDAMRGPVGVARKIDPAARSTARRLVDEVLTAHGLRIAGRGAEPAAASGPMSPGASGPAPVTSEPRIDPRAAAAARRIVAEVLRDHDQSLSGPPPPPSQRERAPVTSVLLTDADGDIDPATAARRIVEQVRSAHEETSGGLDVPEPAVPPDPVEDDPIPDELFTLQPPSIEDDVPPIADDAGAADDVTRTAARIVADVLAARTAATHGPDVEPAPTAATHTPDVQQAPPDPVPPVGFEPDDEEWLQPRPPRRTGRWLLTTVLGAIALAYLFPLAVRAVRDLVALS